MAQSPHKNLNKDARKNFENNSESLGNVYRRLAPYLNIGYVWAASVIIFTLLGIYLDKHWSTKPWFTLLGAILGIVAGFYNFIKTAMTEEKKPKVHNS